MLPQDLVEKLTACSANDFVTEKAALSHWLSASTWTVVAGLLLELPELVHEVKDITRQRIGRFKYRVVLLEEHAQVAKFVAFIGWILIVVGVYGEVHFGDKLGQLGSSIQECSDAKVRAVTLEAGDAAASAKTAREESTAAKTEADAAKLSAGEALTRAHAAERSLAKAESDAGKAQTAAANSLTTATDAAVGAGKAEASLGKAEAEATNAEASASNALTLAREAATEAKLFERELDRIRLPRTLIRQTEFNLKTLQFMGTEYTFASVFQDDEAITFLQIIDAALQDAGWRRVKPPAGFPAINVYGTAQNFAVPVGFGTRVTLTVESNELVSVLTGTPETKLPANVRAAEALAKALSWSTSPREELTTVILVSVVPGNSPTVRIAVGKKRQAARLARAK